MKVTLLSGWWSSLRTLNRVRSSTLSIEFRIATALSIEKGSCISADSTVFQLSLSLSLCLFLDISVNSMIASMTLSMDPPFLFFPVEVSKWASCFPFGLLHCPIFGGRGSSSTSPGLSGSTLTCTPYMRKEASNSRSSSLLGLVGQRIFVKIRLLCPCWRAVLATHSGLAPFYKNLCI